MGMELGHATYTQNLKIVTAVGPIEVGSSSLLFIRSKKSDTNPK